MKHEIMRLVTKTFIAWLSNRLPPAGQPHLHDLEARLMVIIDMFPEGIAPYVNDPAEINEKQVGDSFDWLFDKLIAANASSSWVAIAAHSLRLHAMDAAPEIPRMLAIPPKLEETKKAT